MSKIKVLFLSIFFPCSLYTALGQTSNEIDMYSGEVTKMVNIPNSPQAQAFEKYGNSMINRYSGVPEVEVPLHVFKGQELDLPFQLTYDATGIQVEQQATWVGLSWNLNVGGRISRITNGLPDDYISGGYNTIFNDSATWNQVKAYLDLQNLHSPQFSSAIEAENYLKFLHDMNYNKYEAQQDYFSLNVLGLNEIIVFDKKFDQNSGQYQNIPKVLNNPRIKVSPLLGTSNNSISGWLITGDDGTQYHFQETEKTIRQNANDISQEGSTLFGDAGYTTYNSSWLLTKIVSQNKKDTYEFFYNNLGVFPREQFASSYGVAITTVLDYSYNYQNPPLSPSSGITSEYQLKQLQRIEYNNSIIAQVNTANRYDLSSGPVNGRLESLEFLDYQSNTIKEIEFDNNDYFNLDNAMATNLTSFNKEYYDVRLKLNRLTIRGRDNQIYETYGFEYHQPDNLPSRDSFAQDYFGFYNGEDSNSNLYIKYETSGYTFGGADREPNSTSSRIGMLDKITYPTKGHTTFTYESHDEFKNTQIENEESAVFVYVNGAVITDPGMYDEITPCDDKFLGQDPKVLIKKFQILEEDNYELEFSSSGNSEFYLVKGGNWAYLDYCDFYNGPNELEVLYGFNSQQLVLEDLSPGKYIALVIVGKTQGGSGSSYETASLRVSRNVVTSFWSNVAVGGNRISKITDYSTSGNAATIRKFSYVDENDESTGVVNFEPNLYDFRFSETNNGNQTQLVRYGSYVKGNQPFIVYSEVTEEFLDNQGGSLGTTKYKYNTGQRGIVHGFNPPYEVNYFPNLNIGKVKEKLVKNNTGDHQYLESVSYYETLEAPINVRGLLTYTDEENYGKTPFIKENIYTTGPNTGLNYYTIEYLDSFYCNGSVISPTFDTSFCTVPDVFINPQNYGYDRWLHPKYAIYRGRTNFANGAYGGVSEVVKTTFLKDSQGNQTSINTIETKTYVEDGIHTPEDWPYLPIRSTTTDSQGNIIENTYTYPSTANPQVNKLVSKNNLTEVVKNRITLNPNGPNSKTISTIEKSYTEVALGVVQPSIIKTSKGDDQTSNKVEFEYYSNGNVLLSRKTEGPSTYYIWGYNSKLLIATIENFDEDDALLLQTSIANCQTASNNDDGTVAAEEVLRTALETLRESIPSDSFMTSYTYDPLIGPTSMTDARGITIHYTYDGRNRLETVRDHESKFLTRYDYGFKGQN